MSVRLAMLLFAATAACLFAQEEQSLNDALPPDIELQVLTPEQNRIDMDIRTSTLSELAAWCRSLGLSEGGTSVELARRLREYYKVIEQTPQGDTNRKTITIESARTSEYFKIEAVDEEYARLSGEVRISLKDGDAVHRIRAWNILFNRSRNILTASGGVEYIKEEGDKIETFRGDSITVDIDNWSSIFLGGVSERSLQSDETTYQFAGTVISRDEEEVTILNKASISTANNPESLWSLNATRVWLLPGSDFAVFNAILKVGEIPVMYIPFFYYPADEVIFHPVIGYRTREGNFVQTTTYVMGRPKATSSTQSSLTKILGSSNDMEKKREGLFLRSTGKKAVDANAISLKAMVDYYSNLGSYIGADLVLPSFGLLGPVNFSLGIGLTRTIVKDASGNWTPFFPVYDGSTDWNKSNLFSHEVPFRYRLKTDSSLRGKYGSFSWNLPFYSDPLMDSDFLNRTEEMDWVNMIQKGAALDEEETAQNQLGSYSWQLSGNLTPSFPDVSPYITAISISSISSTVSFRTFDTRNTYPQNDIKRYSPSSFFFAPDTATLYSMSGSIVGTPLSLGGNTGAQTTAQTDKNEWSDPLLNIGIPRSPFEDKEKEEAPKKDQSDTLVPPELKQRFDLPRAGINRFSVAYRIAPSGASTLKFDNKKWETYDDINWGDATSVLSSFGGDASTTLTFNHSENLYVNTFTYSGNWTWKDYWSLNEEAGDFLDSQGETDPVKVDNAKLQEYRQSFFSTSYGLTSTLRPLYLNPIFGASNLQYNLKGLAVRSKFDEDNGSADDPEWEMLYADWIDEKVDTHQFATNLSAQVMDKTQTLSLTADLPPKDASLLWRTGLRIWITETDANMKILYPAEEDRRKLEPFNFTERLNFWGYGILSQTMVLDTEERHVTTLTTAMNLPKWGFSASYSAARMQGYEYIPADSGEATTGWVQKTGDPTLQSRDFSMSYVNSMNMKQLWKDRLDFSFNINTKLFFDLQRYTSSTFTFSLGFTTKINKFVDLTMSTNSENAAIYRYFRNMAPFNSAPIDIPDGPQNNLFLDLVNSFRFDDEELRRSSGFKMKNFRISAIHYLGDWNAILNWTMSPYRPTNARRYEINNEVSFLIQWIPISEIKSDVSYNKRNDPEWKVQGLGN